MAMNSFGRGKGEGEMAESLALNPGSTNLTAFIDQGSEFEGKLTFKDTVRIDGNFRGEISSENTLIVGEAGMVEATIRSNTVVVSGTVIGDITASRQLVLHKSACVQGDLSTPSLVIEEGAKINGGLSMGRPDAKAAVSAPLKSIDGGGAKDSLEPMAQNKTL
jgi:cytoskeletal protein CcmA (bactofilin family)